MEAEDFVLENSVDENAKSGKSSDSEFLDEEGGFFSVNGQELGVGKLLTQDFEMFVHDLAALELFVEEVHDCELEFGDVVQELVFFDLG